MKFMILPFTPECDLKKLLNKVGSLFILHQCYVATE